MDELKKMVTAIANTVSMIASRMDTIEKKLDQKADATEMREGFKKINERLDKQGKFLAFLEDDAPTIKEFGKLEERVAKLEKGFVSSV